MAGNQQEGYQAGTLDKESNDALRDITGARVSGADTLRDITGESLSAGEQKQLRNIFNILPEGLEELVNGESLDADADEGAQLEAAATPEQEGANAGEISGEISVGSVTPPVNALNTGISLAEFGFADPDFDDIPTGDALDTMGDVIDRFADQEAATDIEQWMYDIPDDHELLDEDKNHHEEQARGYFSALVIGSNSEAARYRNKRGVVEGFGPEVGDDEDNPRTSRAKQMIMDSTAQSISINAEINNINFRLGEIAQERAEWQQKYVDKQKEIDKLDQDIADKYDEYERLGAEADTAKSDLAELTTLRGKMSEAMSRGDGVINKKTNEVFFKTQNEQGEAVYYRLQDGEFTQIDQSEMPSIEPGQTQCFTTEDNDMSDLPGISVNVNRENMDPTLAAQYDAMDEQQRILTERAGAARRGQENVMEEIRGLEEKRRTTIAERDVIQTQLDALDTEEANLRTQLEGRMAELEASGEDIDLELLNATARSEVMNNSVAEYEKLQASWEQRFAVEGEIARLEEEKLQLEEFMGDWGYDDMAAIDAAYNSGQLSPEYATTYEQYKSGIDELADNNSQLTSLKSNIDGSENELTSLEQELAQLEAEKQALQEQLDRDTQAETVAIEAADSAQERALVDYHGNVVHTDERFFGMGLSYVDPETGEIKEHGMISSVAGQAAHAWQDLWKGDAQTGQEITAAQREAAQATTDRARTERDLARATRESDALRERIQAEQGHVSEPDAPGMSVAPERNYSVAPENTSRVGLSAASADISAPIEGSLSESYAFAGLPRSTALDVDGGEAPAMCKAPTGGIDWNNFDVSTLGR